MTTIFEEEVTCAVCGAKQTVQKLGSTNSFGAMDLDTRPPEMRRSTMDHWVHECDECGYVAADLGDAGEAGTMTSVWHAYLAELHSPQRPRLANRLVCRALLDESAGNPAAAGWRRLHAAWACDDAERAEEARMQRRAALALFQRARAAGQHAMKSVAGGDEVLLADIARRAGEFEQATEFCAAGLALPDAPAFVIQLLVLEQELVAARDVGRHRVSEAEDADDARVTVH
jgi:rubredoxin